MFPQKTIQYCIELRKILCVSLYRNQDKRTSSNRPIGFRLPFTSFKTVKVWNVTNKSFCTLKLLNMEGILRKQCTILSNYLGFDYNIVETKMVFLRNVTNLFKSASAVVLALNSTKLWQVLAKPWDMFWGPGRMPILQSRFWARQLSYSYRKISFLEMKLDISYYSYYYMKVNHSEGIATGWLAWAWRHKNQARRFPGQRRIASEMLIKESSRPSLFFDPPF